MWEGVKKGVVLSCFSIVSLSDVAPKITAHGSVVAVVVVVVVYAAHVFSILCGAMEESGCCML